MRGPPPDNRVSWDAVASPGLEETAELGREAGACARDYPLAAVDHLIAACGAWAGCLEHRTLRPLLPARTHHSVPR
jgi:hypothetical protein